MYLPCESSSGAEGPSGESIKNKNKKQKIKSCICLLFMKTDLSYHYNHLKKIILWDRKSKVDFFSGRYIVLLHYHSHQK